MLSQELIFVYNADSSVFAAATDFVKKIVTPEKYDCNLCKVTYRALKMQNAWKEYLEKLPQRKTFLHRDEFITKYPNHKEVLPAILIKNNPDDIPEALFTASEINTTKTVQDLIVMMHTKGF